MAGKCLHLGYLRHRELMARREERLRERLRKREINRVIVDKSTLCRNVDTSLLRDRGAFMVAPPESAAAVHPARSVVELVERGAIPRPDVYEKTRAPRHRKLVNGRLVTIDKV